MKLQTTGYEGTMSPPSTILVLVVLALVPTSRLAAQVPDLITDRPDQTESTAIVPRGYVQLEAGWTFARDEVASTRTDAHNVATSLLRIGVANRLEARVGFAGWNRMAMPGAATVSGAGDFDVGFKYQVLEGRGTRPQVAVLGSVTLPTGASAFRVERVEPAVRVAVSHDVSDRIGLGYNLAGTLTTDAGSASARTVTSFFYSVALGVGLTDRLGAFIESFGTLEPSAGRASTHSLDGGFTLLLLPLLQLDVNGGIGLNDAADDWFVGAGMALLVGG